jgi:hypothetical protein
VTIETAGVPAMLLPPIAMAAPNGLAAYRHRARLQSEAFLFDELRHVARRGDAAAFHGALERWLARLDTLSPQRTADTLAVAAGDAGRVRELAVLEARLFCPAAGGLAPWSARRTMHHVSAARRLL